jgi:hypothetical protein
LLGIFEIWIHLADFTVGPALTSCQVGG